MYGEMYKENNAFSYQGLNGKQCQTLHFCDPLIHESRITGSHSLDSAVFPYRILRQVVKEQFQGASKCGFPQIVLML